MWNQIATHISQTIAQPFQIVNPRSVSGGCINQGYQVVEGDRAFFVKLNQASQVAMFEAEAAGLREMSVTQTIRVPQPICVGTVDTTAYLVLEWLKLGRGTATHWAALGHNLAAMHRSLSPNGFGWQRCNTIGSTPQVNPWTPDWASFWASHRIGYQLGLARKRGAFPLGDRLLAEIPKLLSGHNPAPSLVHGDLWSGNAAVTQAGEPVIFDPATYYGDREVDIAMTELFGGFPLEFYQGYRAAFPLDHGYESRKTLYNLYHVLNHFNLFGGGYAAQANRMMAAILT